MVFIIILILAFLVIIIGYWWRYHSLACPASLAWLVENPYVNIIAGPELLFRRMRLAEGMKTLDVGSGPGRLSIPASHIVGQSGEVVALDIQEKMLDKLRVKIHSQNITNIRLINAGAGDGKIPPDYFDRALLVTVLGEIKDKDKALKEIYGALKSNGILSITELIPDPHYTSRNRIRELCVNAGFKELALFGNWFCFTINFIKQDQIKPDGKAST